MTVVLWDSLGTLLDLEPVRAPFAAAGKPQGLEAWFERILHSGCALSLAGEFHPFAELAESTLPAALAQLGLPPDDRAPLEALQRELRPNDDVAPALDVLEDARIASWIVTNGGADSTREALARGGVEGRFAGIVSIDDVGAWKPARAPYAETLRRAGAEPHEAWLVADADPPTAAMAGFGPPIDSSRFGPVPLSLLVGRAWFRYGPVRRIGMLPRIVPRLARPPQALAAPAAADASSPTP